MSLLMLAVLIPYGSLAAKPEHKPEGDPFFPFQWNLRRIGAPAAWKVSQGAGATIAVIDDIVDYRHEELRGKVRLVFGVKAGVCHPREDDCSAKQFDVVGDHGTFVASVAAAKRNNGKGIAGVAPRAKLISIDYTEPLAKVIRWAANQGADVINLSLRVGIHSVDVGPVAADVPGHVRSAIEYAWKRGAVIIAGAANDLLPLCGSMHRRMLCVGAVDHNDIKAWYSNFGVGVHLWAPGGLAYSVNRTCDPDDVLMQAQGLIVGAINTGGGDFCGQKGYWTSYGTSFAAPHVSGVAALLASQGLSNKQIFRCLLRTADHLGVAGDDPVYGPYGRVNAYRAVTEC